MSSKRRKIIINNMEVTIQNENDEAQFLEYIECNDPYVVEETQFSGGEQFAIATEDGTIVQYIEPEYDTGQEQEINEVSEQEAVITLIHEPMAYMIIKGQRENSLFLYCNRQLYKKNRAKYYRCRLFPSCSASGRIMNNLFHLLHPHADHEDQEDLKNSLTLFNSLKFKSAQNSNNFNNIYEEECAKPEFSNVVDSTKEKLLATKVLKRNRDAFKILRDLLGDEENIDPDDEREFNNFGQNEITPIEGLGIRTKIIFSAGHIYLHTGTSTYRCYLYPKCLAMGFYLNGQGVCYFQLIREHTQHSYKDIEKDVLLFVAAVKKRAQQNPTNVRAIFEEESTKECYAHIQDRLSFDVLLKLFTRLGTLGTSEEAAQYKELPEPPLKVPRAYRILDGGSGGHVLFCDNQLYNSNNRSGYYRCRLYQQGCPATGQRLNNMFTLTRAHVGHWSQIVEKNKLMFTASLRRRAATESLPLQTIYQQEMRNPDFKAISSNLPYTSVYKIMKRARTYGITEVSKNPDAESELEPELLDSTIETVEIEYEDVEAEPEVETDETVLKLSAGDAYNVTDETSNAKNKNPRLPCMEYTLMEGERLGSCILYSNEQLYTLNRNNYYRCRMYPQGCQSTGMREGNVFRLCRGHSGHGSQEPERRRIILINTIKKKTMTNPDPDYFDSVFNRECEKPEYADIVERVSFTVILNNMRKIWKRYQQQDPTLTRNIMRSDLPEDLHQKMNEREAKDKNENLELEDQDDLRMAVDVGADIPCDKDISPKEYSLMEGERLGSCILYCNQQLYTNNQRNYYRCRMYAIGCRATGIIKDSLFQLLKPHNGHGSQEREVRRLILITGIKRRAQIDPTRLQTIFNEECAKPEFADVADMVNFKKIYSTLDRCRRRAANDVLEVIEPKIPPGITAQESQAREDQLGNQNSFDSIPADDYNDHELGPKEYSLMDSEDLRSCILYCNQQLYVNNANSKYGYRCRLFKTGCKSIGFVKNGLFQLMKAHNGHESQERDVRRLVLISKIKKRAQIDPTQLQSIFDEECAKPEFQDVGTLVDYEDIVSFLTANPIENSATLQSDVVELKKDSPASFKLHSWGPTVDEPMEEMDDVQYYDEQEQPEVFESGEADIENEECTIVQQMTQEELISELGLADSGDENTLNGADINEENISTNPYVEDGDNFVFIGGDRYGSKLLYSEGQLYCLNRDNYFRCRVYPNCIATGRVYGAQFRLHRGHSVHPLQDEEKTRLILMNSLKTRVQQETAPIKMIFDEECAKPEFRDVAPMINYKTIFNTLMKCRTRAIHASEKEGNESDASLERLTATSLNAFDQDTGTEHISDEEGPTPDWDLEDCSVSDTDEVLEVPKPDMKTPTKYTMIQGDRTGSLILYSNGHLYTKNRGSYYRCRLHPACYGSGNRRGNLFYMTRQHSDHPLQDDEKCRLALMGTLKKRVLQENTPLKVIYDEEIVKSEFAAIADLVSFKMIQSTMIKIRERVRYGQEPGTVMLSTEAVTPLKIDDEEEIMDVDEQLDSEVDEQGGNDAKKKNKNDAMTDRYVYYYILDWNDSEIDDVDLKLNLGEKVRREVYSPINEDNDRFPLVVYMVDVDNQEANESTFKRKIHLPDEKLIIRNANELVNHKQIENQEPLKYIIIEDCLNDKLLLYAGKQLYVKRKNRYYSCRIKTCHALGHIRNGAFCLVYNHNNHISQSKVKLQLQLISRIRTRCLERKTARVSKVFREECTRPEFRMVANTITLDGISDMVRRNRRKMYPRLLNPPSDIISESMLSELPPPVEFSMVNGSKPEIRLLHCIDALFYHASKGVYRCHVNGCKSFGRRDRIFFQLLAPHTEHEAVDLNDKEKLLEIIKQTELYIMKKKMLGETDQEDKEPVDEISVPQIKYEQEDTDVEDDTVVHTEETSEDKGSNQKSILEQAWEELQVHI